MDMDNEAEMLSMEEDDDEDDFSIADDSEETNADDDVETGAPHAARCRGSHAPGADACEPAISLPAAR